MAATRVPSPGSTYGPCELGCKHIDCADSRMIAGSVCRLCGEAIHYDVRYYGDPDTAKAFVHACCLEATV
jgi:hypothetical protein